MSEAQSLKNTIIKNMHKLCAHCVNGSDHRCPIQTISEQVSNIKGVPLIVNDEFKGILFI